MCLDGVAAERFEAVRLILDRYQPLALERLGTPVELRLSSTTDCRFIQAYGGHDTEGRPHVTFFPGLLREFSSNAVLFTLCHELGHLFGQVTPQEAGVVTKYDMRDSLEGEADYFAGSCVLGALRDESLALEASREALQKFMGPTVDIDPARAMKKKYRKGKGIDPEYPNPDCRLLTIENGIRDLPRPACWYNPKDRR